MEDINYYIVKIVWQTQPFKHETHEGKVLEEALGARVLQWAGLQGFHGTLWFGFFLQRALKSPESIRRVNGREEGSWLL